MLSINKIEFFVLGYEVKYREYISLFKRLINFVWLLFLQKLLYLRKNICLF